MFNRQPFAHVRSTARMFVQSGNRGFDIDDQKAIEGLAKVNLPGRMEIINKESAKPQLTAWCSSST